MSRRSGRGELTGFSSSSGLEDVCMSIRNNDPRGFTTGLSHELLPDTLAVAARQYCTLL